jgi:hypothetical protein
MVPAATISIIELRELAVSTQPSSALWPYHPAGVIHPVYDCVGHGGPSDGSSSAEDAQEAHPYTRRRPNPVECW